MKYVITAAISLITASMVAQENFTISGYVSENYSGESLPWVTISIGSSIGTTTNDYGFYSISLESGSYDINISYLGYQTIERSVTLTSDMTLNFQMEDDAHMLEEVVVVANVKGEGYKNTEMSVDKIQAKFIERLPPSIGEPDILKTIQLLPGVSSVNEASSGFNVRGGSSDQNLVLLDEATIYNASHLLGFFSVFNASAIKDLKLYKGAIPSIFGGRLSSVLDIKQKEGNIKKLGGELGIGLISSKALVEGPLFNGKDKEEGKGSFMVAGRRSYADLFLPLADLGEFTLYFYDLNLKTNFKMNDKNRIYASGYFGRDNLGVDGIFGVVWGNGSGTLRWTSIINDKLFLQTSASYSDYEYKVDVLSTATEYQWSSNIINYNLRPRLSWFINNSTTLKVGLDATNYIFDPGEIIPLAGSSIEGRKFQDKYAVEASPYLDFNHDITEGLSIQVGLRWSNFIRQGKGEILLYENGTPLSYDPDFNTYQENPVIGSTSYKADESVVSFNQAEPRLAMRYLINDKSSIKVSYNRNAQYLHLISNSNSPTPLDIWAPSGPFLKPQFSDQFALGYNMGLANNKFDFTIETYYKKLSNVTNFVDGADVLFAENIETETIQGNGRAYGLEVQVNKNSGKLTGWLSYTLSKTENIAQGINYGKYFNSDNDQTHEISLVGLYKVNDKWEFGGSFVYGSGRPVNYPTGKYNQNGLVVADYNGRNGDRLPAFHRLDISATLTPKKDGNSTWLFSIANVYNRHNAASINFREKLDELADDVKTITGKTEASKFSFFGIVPSVMYTYKF